MTKEQLQVAVNNQFKKPFKVMEIVQIAILYPTIELIEKENRLLSDFDAELKSPLLNFPLTAHIQLSGQLSFDASDQSIKLVAPKIEHVDLHALSANPSLKTLLEALKDPLQAALMKEITLYTLSPEELTIQGKRYQPTAFNIQSNTLIITLSPIKP